MLHQPDVGADLIDHVGGMVAKCGRMIAPPEVRGREAARHEESNQAPHVARNGITGKSRDRLGQTTIQKLLWRVELVRGPAVAGGQLLPHQIPVKVALDVAGQRLLKGGLCLLRKQLVSIASRPRRTHHGSSLQGL